MSEKIEGFQKDIFGGENPIKTKVIEVKENHHTKLVKVQDNFKAEWVDMEKFKGEKYGLPPYALGTVDYKIFLNAECTIDVVPNIESSGTKKGLNYDRKNKSCEGFKFKSSAKRTVRNRLSCYFTEVKKGVKYTWATFTIPELKDSVGYKPKIHDRYLMNSLRRFLDNLRKNQGLLDYMIVSERHKNGKIHFHAVLIHKAVFNVQQINCYWLRTCEIVRASGKYKGYYKQVGRYKRFVSPDELIKGKLEYVDKFYRSKYVKMNLGQEQIDIKVAGMVKIYRRAYLENNEDFFLMRKHKSVFSLDPHLPAFRFLYPAVDFKPIAKTTDGFKKLRTYMTKYITKNNSVFYCRPFINSRGFSKLNERIVIDTKLYRKICSLWSPIERVYDLQIGSITWTARKLFINEKFIMNYAEIVKENNRGVVSSNWDEYICSS